MRAEVAFENLGWVPFDATPGGTCICTKGDNRRENQAEEKETGEKISAEGGACGEGQLCELVGKTGKNFIRTNVGEIYENGFWRPMEGRRVDYSGQELGREDGIPLPFETRRVKVRPSVPMKGYIPSFPHPIRLMNAENLTYYPEKYTFFSSKPVEKSYTVAYQNYQFEREVLVESSFSDNEAYLQLSSSVTKRTLKLSEEITQGLDNSYKEVEAVEKYLETNYEYDENYTRAPPGQDPIDWFLFEEKKGVCANFNSAFVILARCAGIPSRVVSGFIVKPNSEYQIVFKSQCHLRAEVLFEKLGWVPFDATPGGTCTCTKRDNQKENQTEKTQTFTKITDFDKSETIGNKFHVSGKVRTDEKNPVAGLTVLIYLRKWKGENTRAVANGETDKNGYFNIRFKLGEEIERGEYYVVAQSIGTEKYKGSWSDPKTELYENTEIFLSTPNQEAIDKKFNIEGKLLEEVSRDAIAHKRVKLTLGGENIVKTTNENGCFNLVHSFENPENFVIKASFEGAKYLLPSKVENTIEIVPLKIVPNTENQLVRGENATALGYTTLYEKKIEILVDDKLVAEGESSEKGEFSRKFTVPSSASLGVNTLTYRLPEYSYTVRQKITVFAHPSINYQTNKKEILPGDRFKIKAEIRNDLGRPITNSLLELRYGDNSQMGGFGEVIEEEERTGEEGKTTFQIHLPKTYENDTFTFFLNFPKQGYYLSEKIEGKLQIAAVEITPKTDNKLVRGEREQISGWTNVERANLKILLNNVIIAERQTEDNGEFNFHRRINKSSDLGKGELSYRLPDYKVFENQEVGIYARTRINHKVESREVSPGDNFTVIAKVFDNLENPVENKTLKLNYENKWSEERTDNGGRVVFNEKIRKNYEKENLVFRLVFPAQGFYLSSAPHGSVKVTSKPFFSNLFWMVLGIIAASLSLVTVVIMRRKGERPGEIGGKTKKTGGGEREEPETAVEKGRFDLEINFSSIDDRFPDVWGVDDPLQIMISLKGNGEPGEKELDFKIDGEKVEKLKTDASGQASLKHKFEEKGTYEVGVFFRKGQIEADRAIRIVEYREEIVRLFNSSFNLYKDHGIDLREETTPREFQRKVSELEKIDRKALERMTTIFEIARYSLHPIGRSKYEKMYNSYKKVVSSGRD
ncbi:hypothetical protein AKJ61_03320 [candidate division MSBL1 archaeon SCGC-AAA259B11]|uniref:Transglutaminase-like domain-containing protein n=1 Tax=candidate division MSBL1 archaeon SCGC-AAA259B11 TaxID=1698260 RepID=A0A133U4X9_9EURY|nr:hypothetical protein AKJ61_03320 [candidate division MSBL1 archaeon SCGC-AAA259B11]